jgi:hypothetical protein
MALPLPSAEFIPGGQVLQGLNAINQSQNALLNSQIQHRYAQPMAEQNLNKLLAGNRLTNAEAQRYENRNPFEAGLMQAQIAEQNALASRAPFENRFQEAQTNSLNAGLPFIAPMKQEELLKEQLFNKFKQADLPFEADRMKALIARNNALARGGAAMGAANKAQLVFQSNVSQDNPQFTPEQVYAASNAIMDGKNTLPDGTPINVSPTARNSLDVAQKYTMTAAKQKQISSALQLQSIFDKGDELIPDVVRFAGAAGKANQTASAFGSSLGKDNPDYSKFKIFTTQIVPQAANLMMTTEGVNMTDMQKKIMVDVANPITWDRNPKQAMEAWNYLTKTFRESVDKNVATGLSESLAKLKRDNNELKNKVAPSNQLTFSADDIKETAKKYGKSESEIRDWILKKNGKIKD